MENLILSITSRLPIKILLIGIIILDIYIYFSDIKIGNELKILLFFSGTVSFIFFIHYFYKIIEVILFGILDQINEYGQCKRKVQNSIDNLYYLSQEEQNILWSMYFEENNKSTLSLSNKYIKNLLDNHYISKIQKLQNTGKGIFILTRLVKKDLDGRYKKQIKQYLEELSQDEKDVLNLFFDGGYKEGYPSSYSQAINSLKDKKIIESKDKKTIMISKYAKDCLTYFNAMKIKHMKVEIGEHNIYAPYNRGGGVQGSR